MIPAEPDVKSADRMDSIRIWLLFASAMIGVFIAAYNAFDDATDQLRDHDKRIEGIELLNERVIRLEILAGSSIMSDRVHHSKIKQVQRDNSG